jgi:hypothetical protein
MVAKGGYPGPSERNSALSWDGHDYFERLSGFKIFSDR